MTKAPHQPGGAPPIFGQWVCFSTISQNLLG